MGRELRGRLSSVRIGTSRCAATEIWRPAQGFRRANELERARKRETSAALPRFRTEEDKRWSAPTAAMRSKSLATVSQPIVVLTGDLQVKKVNYAFCRAFEVNVAESEGRQFHDLGNVQRNIPELRKLLHEVLSERNEVRDYRVEHEFEHIGQRIMLVNARRMAREEDDEIVLAINDISESERQRHELEGRREFGES